MSDKRLARPVYEALPWVYMVCGVAALIASYFTGSHLMSFVLGIPGLVAVLGGVVVALRRRDFRKMRENYLNTSSSVLPKEKD